MAADINKHVVYARDARRAVVGRCLLALDDVGRILSFFPYCHDGELGFEKMVGELVEELAGEMKTHVVPRGTVPCLVAPDWYDDGPLDVCRRFPFLEEGSEFQKSLTGLVARDEFVACLERHFAPVPLNAHALSLVLELPEFDAFPGMVRPLLPLLDGCRNLDDRTWMRAARIAEAAGESDFVGRVLRKRGVRHVLWTRRGSRLDDAVMLMLMEHDPSATIRVVRATRARRVRSDTTTARVSAGVPKSGPAAAQWYRRAAEQGHVESQYWLGAMYKYRLEVRKDRVEEGHRAAQFEYGRDCEDGRGVPADWAEAAVWYRRAAEQGHVEAHLRLGDLYVVRDDVEAVRWYRAAAERGHDGACFNPGSSRPRRAVSGARPSGARPTHSSTLGRLYAGREPPDDALAFKWLSLAACHAHGTDVERMAAKARDDVAARMKVDRR